MRMVHDGKKNLVSLGGKKKRSKDKRSPEKEALKRKGRRRGKDQRRRGRFSRGRSVSQGHSWEQRTQHKRERLV